MKSDHLYLGHIRDAIGRIHRYTSGGKAAFLQDEMAQDAVVRNLEIIGEATKNMSENLKEGHGNVPWSDIARMRDKVIHDYAGVRMGIVWEVVERDLPPLIAEVEEMLKELGG